MAKENETVVSEEIKAQILAGYKSEIDSYIAEKLKDFEVKTEQHKRAVNKDLEEEVLYTFFKDGENYSGDVFISVNAENIVVQRGVPVRIKRKFVLAYEDAERQRKTATAISNAEETRAKRNGI